jgi:hypothetical protein
MAQTENLTRYDVVKSEKHGWELKAGGKTVAWRATKVALLDDLQAMLDRFGDGDGTVHIHTEIGGIEEERTYPRAKDPRKSPG